MELLATRQTDAVSTVLDRINVRSVVYCLSELSAPWGFQVDASPAAKFHLVLGGQATLSAGGGTAVLTAGELALLPRGSGHAMRDSADSPAPPLAGILDGAAEPLRLRFGGDGARTRLLCGGFGLAADMPADLLERLPPLLILDATHGDTARWLAPALELLREETALSTPGAAAVLAKLADVFLTEIVRAHLADLSVVAVQDPAIDAAVTLLRSQLAAPWTVADLARKAGVSRTAFAARFRELVGEPPMSYLARHRLRQAAVYLTATDKTIREIAHLVGYDSEASLSKAFRRAYDQPPGGYRRLQRAAGDVRATESPALADPPR